jgi:copper resistance protein B
MGESGRMAARMEIAYQHWFTQKLSLTPDFEANFYSEDDPERDIGSGLSDLDLGLRLRYQVIRGVSPYTGITWKGNLGNTADMITGKGEETSDLRFILGVTLRY